MTLYAFLCALVMVLCIYQLVRSMQSLNALGAYNDFERWVPPSIRPLCTTCEKPHQNPQLVSASRRPDPRCCWCNVSAEKEVGDAR